MSYVSELLTRPNATEIQEDTLVDATGVAWHYGNPLGEQRAAEDGSAIVDRSHRAVIKVSGPDAPEFLNNLLSQKLDVAPVGFAAGALDLDMQGHILHAAQVVRTEDAFYLDLPQSQAQSLQDFLTKMVFWSDVQVEATDLGIITVLGTELPAPNASVYSRSAQWQDFALPRTEVAAAVAELEAAGGRLAGLMAFTAERVKAREPELAADLDNKSIPHEVPQWIGRGDNPGAVHLEKGCYRGQETVARVENLGRSPRVLVQLHLDGSAPSLPTAGSDITAGGRRVGRLGTVVDDCDFGPIALALVKRSALTTPLSIAVTTDKGDTYAVAAQVDPDSLPADEGPKAGRAAIEKLRGL